MNSRVRLDPVVDHVRNASTKLRMTNSSFAWHEKADQQVLIRIALTDDLTQSARARPVLKPPLRLQNEEVDGIHYVFRPVVIDRDLLTGMNIPQGTVLFDLISRVVVAGVRIVRVVVE